MTKNGGEEISSLTLTSYYRKEEEDGYKNCSNKVLTAFLDGLIIKKRGPRPKSQPKLSGEINNPVKTTINKLITKILIP
jgi:uncharacterized protein YehS (DUF1456 family)